MYKFKYIHLFALLKMSFTVKKLPKNVTMNSYFLHKAEVNIKEHKLLHCVSAQVCTSLDMLL